VIPPRRDPIPDEALIDFLERSNKVKEELASKQKWSCQVLLAILALSILTVALTVAQVTIASVNMAYFSDQRWALNQQNMS